MQELVVSGVDIIRGCAYQIDQQYFIACIQTINGSVLES